MKILPSIALMAALFSVALGASAQWTWIDKDGRKVFSDRPPPAEVSERNIIKRPGAAASTQAPMSGGSAEPNAASKAPASGLKPGGTDKELADKLKAADDAEAARKKAEEERIARVKADNCNRARQAKATYDSGATLTRVNARGEREIVSDAARAAETERLDGIIGSDCH